MPKYEVEALRTIRVIQSQHERAGHDAQAEQMRKVGDQVEGMVGELAALRCAAEALLSDVDKYYRCADIVESRGNLARLCGEE